MKTRVTELLGIEYPIIQGGMAWVATHELASAVSNAGGLGIIGAGGAPASWVREQIQAAKKETDKPFGVNLMLMNPEADKIAKVILEEDIKVVTTGAGSPEKYMADWKAAGVKVIPVIASVALAKRMERCGADAVVAEGTEGRWTYRRAYHNGTGSAGCRCGEYPGDRSGRYCRRQRHGSGIYAGCQRNPDGNNLCSI